MDIAGCCKKCQREKVYIQPYKIRHPFDLVSTVLHELGQSTRLQNPSLHEMLSPEQRALLSMEECCEIDRGHFHGKFLCFVIVSVCCHQYAVIQLVFYYFHSIFVVITFCVSLFFRELPRHHNISTDWNSTMVPIGGITCYSQRWNVMPVDWPRRKAFGWISKEGLTESWGSADAARTYHVYT